MSSGEAYYDYYKDIENVKNSCYCIEVMISKKIDQFAFDNRKRKCYFNFNRKGIIKSSLKQAK